MNIEALANAYKTVKEGSTVSLIESHEDKNEDGSTSTSEAARTITEVTSDGEKICLGSTCFTLGTPCGGTSSVIDEEEVGSGRRRLATHKKIFERALKGTQCSSCNCKEMKSNCADCCIVSPVPGEGDPCSLSNLCDTGLTCNGSCTCVSSVGYIGISCTSS